MGVDDPDDGSRAAPAAGAVPGRGGRRRKQEEKPVRKGPKGSVLGKLVDPDVIRKLEPLAS